MRRASLVAFAVVLAGCSFAPAGGTPTEAVTPAPVPESVDFPPGVDDSGVVDPDALAEAHVAVIQNRSFTLTSNRTVRDANGSLRSRIDVWVAVTENRTYLANATTAGPEGPVLLGRPPAHGVYWSNGSSHLRKLTQGNRTTYDRIDARRAFTGSWLFWTNSVAYGGVVGRSSAESVYRAAFRAVPTRLDGRRTADGRTVVRLVGEGATSTDFTQLAADEVRDVRLVAVVDERGVVREFRLSYVAVVDGERLTVNWEIRYDRIGATTVARPPWADRAQ